MILNSCKISLSYSLLCTCLILQFLFTRKSKNRSKNVEIIYYPIKSKNFNLTFCFCLWIEIYFSYTCLWVKENLPSCCQSAIFPLLFKISYDLRKEKYIVKLFSEMSRPCVGKKQSFPINWHESMINHYPS